MNAIALAFPFTAASITGGALMYSLKRSGQVFSTSECTRIIFQEISPAFWKSAPVPAPTSTTGICFATSAGAQAIDTARTLNSTAGSVEAFGSVAVPTDETLTTVAPSAHETGIL